MRGNEMKIDRIRFSPQQAILHIPHSSTYIPEDCRDLFYLDDRHLRKELLVMPDRYTDELFNIPGIPEANKIVFPYSRLICDVERFRDDRLECMAARGMGVCYRVTSSLRPLKRVPSGHREEMLVLYDRHHAALTAAADRVLQEQGQGVLIDCHSFPSCQLPYEAVGQEEVPPQRPDICIGTDLECHTPLWLRDFLISGFRERGYSVAENYPFSGTLVPMKYYHSDARLLSVMIEVNRKLYMDEETGRKTENFPRVQADIREVLSELTMQN